MPSLLPIRYSSLPTLLASSHTAALTSAPVRPLSVPDPSRSSSLYSLTVLSSHQYDRAAMQRGLLLQRSHFFHPKPLAHGAPQHVRRAAFLHLRRSSVASAAGEHSGPWDGRDWVPGQEADNFARETTRVVMRSLTARAVMKVLVQLERPDPFTFNWLQRYCSTNPPIKGNEFITHLMAERPRVFKDPSTGATHYVSPTQLANRVLAVRADLAQHVVGSLADEIQRENVTILRGHLEAHTYTSGTHSSGKKGGRGGANTPKGLRRAG